MQYLDDAKKHELNVAEPSKYFLFSVKQKLVSIFTWVYWQHKGKQKFSDRFIFLKHWVATGRQNSFCCEENNTVFLFFFFLSSFFLIKKKKKKECRGRWLDNGWLAICFPSDKWTAGENSENVAIRIKYTINDITAAETTHIIVFS